MDKKISPTVYSLIKETLDVLKSNVELVIYPEGETKESLFTEHIDLLERMLSWESTELPPEAYEEFDLLFDMKTYGDVYIGETTGSFQGLPLGAMEKDFRNLIDYHRLREGLNEVEKWQGRKS